MGSMFVWESLIAGILASFACGLGALPLMFPFIDLKRSIGLGYGFAGGLMFAASVYNLLLPALTLGEEKAIQAGSLLPTLAGLLVGCGFIAGVQRHLTPERLKSKVYSHLGGRVSALVFLTMTFHSIPEGVAVGVGFTSEAHWETSEGLGWIIALAISIHNIPEGLAVALPMRMEGASIQKCFWYAFLTSLPQPAAAVPASLMVWFFEPLVLPAFGFAAGAMMYLVVVELIPDGLESRSRTEIAWSFMSGFAAMVLLQLGVQ